MRTKPFHTWTAALAVVATIGIVILLGGAAVPAQAGPPQDAVLDWNLNTLDALFNVPTAPTRPGAGQAAPVAQQHLAMVHGAVYDAVNMIDGGHEPYLDGLPSAPSTASMPAAVATAAHHVLVGLGIAPVPALPAATQSWLNTAYADSLAAIPNGQAKTDGIAAGTAAASAMLIERTGDGRYVPFPFTCGDDPGEWRPTASPPPPGGPPVPLTCAEPGVSDPFAWVAKVKPWTLTSASQFRSKGEVDLGSQLYVKEYNEVKRLGGNGTTTPHERTTEQQEVAQLFTVNPMPMYSRMLRGLAQSEGLTLVEQARLFALVNIATADAAINVWDDKHHFSNWRPITAIRLGNSDGNPKTGGDSTWTPLNPTPPYPDQSSGYNGVTGAVMHTAKSFFDGNKMEFDLSATVTVGFATPTVITRHYTHFLDVLEDTQDARVWNGIHFRTADVDGATIGRNVAHWVGQNHLRPVQ